MTDDPLGEHVKEVFAHFGAALYHAQVLEHGIVNALVLVDLIPSERHKAKTPLEWESIVDGFMEQQFAKPMGRMMTALRQVADVPDDLEALLVRALQMRNRLAHHFFRECADAFMSESGRDQMIADLEQCTVLFEAADQRLDSIVAPMRIAAGVTNERIAAALEESRRRARDS